MREASYILRLEPRPHHLRAHVCGPEDTLEVSVGYWTEIAAACARGDVRRLLVIEEIEGTARPSDVEDMADALLQLGFSGIRIAFVDATEDAALLVNAEIRAQRNGLEGRVFRREDEAERWLLRDIEGEGAGAADRAD